MNTSPLSDELRRIAAEAPAVPVDPSTWDRARTAQRRDRGLVGAGVSALVAAVVAAVLVLPGGTSRTSPPVADPSGFPDRIRQADPAPLPDLRAGAAAAAYVTPMRHVVLVGGAEPGYRAIEIKERTGAIALSPDGTHLAYGYRYADSDPRNVAGRPATGLGILDLTTGVTRTVPISLHRREITVDRLVWDELGRDVAYVGTVIDTQQTTSGFLGDGGTRSPHLPNPTGSPYLDIYGARVVAVATNDSITRWSFGTLDPVGALDRSGAVVGACSPSSKAFVTLRSDGGGYRASTYPSALATGQPAETELAVPGALRGREVTGVDCLADGRLLVQSGSDLAVVTLGDHASYDAVSRVDPDLLRLTVATGLVE